MADNVLTQICFTDNVQCSKEKISEIKKEFHFESGFYFDSILNKSNSAFKESAAGIVLMRDLLIRLGARPSHIIIRRNSDGRPCICGNGYDFNISHSEGFVLCGAIKGGIIGCDIQAERYIASEKRDRLIRRFMNDEEILKYEEEADKSGFYFSAWSKKEAVIKCFGGSVWNDMKELSGKGVSSSVVSDGERRAFWAMCHQFY